jgi:CheY-like chemotaxis protein
VSNAIKYTPKNGRVDVTVRFELNDGKDGFYFEVRDNGPGVNPEDEKRIFDRYYRSPSGGNGAGGGTGIGLALVRELVRLYGGTVHLSSQVGEGSAFSVWLPLPQPAKYHSQLDGQHEHIAVDLADEDDQRIGGIEGQDKPVVLIVEDNDDLRGFLNTCLVEHYAVMEASNGEEALELAFAHIPDAVVCDLMMPVMDGLEFLEKLKANERTSHVPVILLTAKTSRTDRESALAKGADAYLTKPFYETELLALLNNLLQIRTQTWNLHRAQVMKVRKEGQSNSEETFIAKLRLYIEEHMADATFDTESLSRATAMSRTQLHRKLKAITGISTGVLIRKIRIERARELLEIRESNISEVAYQTGFNTHSYFSRCFAEEYGMSPTEYQKQFGSSNGEMVD